MHPETVNGNPVLAAKRVSGEGETATYIVLVALLRGNTVDEYVTWHVFPSHSGEGWVAESGRYFRRGVNANDKAGALARALNDFERRA